MKKTIITLVLISFFLMNLAISAPKIVYVAKKPPVEKVVKVGPKPFKSVVWISGHWKWNGHKYIWSKGYWTKPKLGKVWRKGHWVKKPRGWIYIKGHWKKR